VAEAVNGPGVGDAAQFYIAAVPGGGGRCDAGGDDDGAEQSSSDGVVVKERQNKPHSKKYCRKLIVLFYTFSSKTGRLLFEILLLRASVTAAE
jgi:hypothetical protein